MINDPSGFCGLDFGNEGGPLSTINGTLQINTHGYVSNNGPIYGTNAYLVYNPGGIYNRNPEWGAASATGQAGYPYHVIVQNNTNLFLNTTINGSADRYMAGNLEVKAGSSISLSETTPTVFGDKLYVRTNLKLDGTLTLPTAYGGDIHVAGDWTRSATGVFVPNDRAVFFDSTINSNVYANNGKYFPYLYINKSALGKFVYLYDHVTIGKLLNIGRGTLDLKDKNVTFRSDINATASLDKMYLGNGAIAYTGTGRFIVERFIPTALTATATLHKKSWQFLAVPISDNVQTVKQAWQEGALTANGNPKPGYGTQLTSNVPNAATQPKPGFDVFTPLGPSIKTYVSANGSWKSIDSTGVPISNKKGYMVFVRGDRSVTTPYPATVTNTTLEAKGKIYDPSNINPPSTTIPAGKFESIGNPYPSAIDFSNDAGVIKSNAFVQRLFYVWDPRLGGAYGYGAYQTFVKNAGDANYTVSPGGGSYPAGGSVYNTIESGQAFLVSAVGGSGDISFNENAKTSGSKLVARPIPAGPARNFRNQLYIVDNGTRTLLDGVLTEFDRNFSNETDALDAVKLKNTGESLGISNGDDILAVERRGMIRRSDSIVYMLGQVSLRQYEFEFIPTGLGRTGLQVYLVDKWLGTETQLSLADTSRYSFAVTNYPGSYAKDRFKVVFRRPYQQVYAILDGTREDNMNRLNWHADTGAQPGDYYEVERSADGKQYQVVHRQPVTENENYQWNDENPLPGVNYYRLNFGKGDDNRSNIVKLDEPGIEPALRIIPNPVKGHTAGLALGGMKAGNYQLRIFSSAGQLLATRVIKYDGKGDTRQLTLPSALAAGIYRVEISDVTGMQRSVNMILE